MAFDPLSAVVSAGSDLLGGIVNDVNQSNTNSSNIAYQKQFAQNGIQWKAADARAAGISPLVALGAPTTQFQDQVAPSMGNSLGLMGQDISRASTAEDPNGRLLAAESVKQAKLQTAGLVLDNQLKSSQLGKLNAPGTPPGVPSSTSAFVPVTNADGSTSFAPSKAAEGSMFNPLEAMGWTWRNSLLPSMEYLGDAAMSSFYGAPNTNAGVVIPR